MEYLLVQVSDLKVSVWTTGISISNIQFAVVPSDLQMMPGAHQQQVVPFNNPHFQQHQQPPKQLPSTAAPVPATPSSCSPSQPTTPTAQGRTPNDLPDFAG